MQSEQSKRQIVDTRRTHFINVSILFLEFSKLNQEFFVRGRKIKIADLIRKEYFDL